MNVTSRTPQQADLQQQVDVLSKRLDELAKQQARSEHNQYANYTVTFTRRPLLKKLSCGLINPERTIIHKMMERRGCALVGVEEIGHKRVRYAFKKKV